MKKLIFFTTSLIISLHGFSQFTFKWSPTASITDGKSTQKTIPYTNREGEVFVLRELSSVAIEQEETYIEKYSISEGLVETTKLNLSTGSMADATTLESYLISGDNLILITKRWQKADKSVTYFASTYSFENGYQNNTTELAKFTVKGLLSQGNQAFAASPDGTKLLMLEDGKKEKKENDKFSFILFDALTFKRITEKEIEVPIQPKRAENTLLVDNNGTGFLHRKYALSGSKFESYIITFNSENKKVRQNALIVPGKASALHETKLIFANNKVFLGGFYTTDYNKISGTFISKIDKNTGTVLDSKAHPFEGEILKLIGIDDLKLIDLLTLKDGRIEVVGEIQYYKKTGSAQSLETQEYNNVRDDIVVSCIKLDLGLDWTNYIGKRQSYKTIGNTKAPWSSFSYALLDDKLHIIYNTHTTPSRWKNPDGVYEKRDEFINTGKYAFMYVLEDNANIIYGDRHYGLPLFKIFKETTSFEPGIYPTMGLQVKNKLYLFAEPKGKKELILGRMDLVE